MLDISEIRDLRDRLHYSQLRGFHTKLSPAEAAQIVRIMDDFYFTEEEVRQIHGGHHPSDS